MHALHLGKRPHSVRHRVGRRGCSEQADTQARPVGGCGAATVCTSPSVGLLCFVQGGRKKKERDGIRSNQRLLLKLDWWGRNLNFWPTRFAAFLSYYSCKHLWVSLLFTKQAPEDVAFGFEGNFTLFVDISQAAKKKIKKTADRLKYPADFVLMNHCCSSEETLYHTPVFVLVSEGDQACSKTECEVQMKGCFFSLKTNFPNQLLLLSDTDVW